MNSPTSRDDDGWNDLYAELGLDKPAPKPSESDPAPVEALREVSVEAEPAQSWPDEVPPIATEAADDMIVEPEGIEDEGDESGESGEGEGGPEEEGPPGTGKKRRRRRRRRKKGAPGATGEEASDAAPELRPVVAERSRPVRDDSRHPSEDEEEPELADEEDVVASGVHDDAGDTLRDLIANWNVPAWDDIISGLYRPER